MTLRFSRSVEEGPGRAGPLLLTVLLATALLFLTSPPARGHGETFEVVVEAVNLFDDPGRLAYGVVLTFVDGHEVTGATVRLSAVSETGSRVEVVAEETTPGVYIGDLTLAPGPWRVNLEIETEGGEEGSVEFGEEVGASPVEVPVVRVDTAHPERQGGEADDSSVFSATESAEPRAETSLGLRVEALVREAVAPLVVEYGVVTDSADVAVSLSARSDRSVALGPVPLARLAPGVFQGVIEYPEAGTWQVTVRVDGPVGGETSFVEALPWPHYTTEAGSPKVKVDSSDPSRKGTLIDIGDSPIFGLAGGESTVPAAAATTVPSAGQDDVVVSLSGSGSEIALQVFLRWLHLAGIGLWGTSIAFIVLGRRSRVWAGVAVGGMIAVAATGTGLALWGAPTSFPGIVSWSELGQRTYGGVYQWAFLVKMGFVLVAVVATARLVAKSTRARVAVAASGMVGALAAVVVMAQVHLFAHL